MKASNSDCEDTRDGGKGRSLDTVQHLEEQLDRLVAATANNEQEIKSLSESLDEVLLILCRNLGFQYGEVWVPDNSEDLMVLLATWYEATHFAEFHEASRAIVFPKRVGIPGTAWVQGTTRWYPDVTQELIYLRANAAKKVGLHAAAVVPVIMDNHVVAILVMYLDEPREENPQMMAVLDRLGQYLTALFQRRSWENELRRELDETRTTLEQFLRLIEILIAVRDQYTAEHQQSVSRWAGHIAAVLGLTGEQVHSVKLAGLIHDVGKFGIPQEILSKPGPLSPHEFGMVQSHVQLGRDILRQSGFPAKLIRIASEHHERMDGSGYPQGLRGDSICIEARILAVMDTAHAMLSHRPYRPALSLDAVLDELRSGAGTKYDSNVVVAFVEAATTGKMEL